jgi:integral membrane sensor domain MASE1
VVQAPLGTGQQAPQEEQLVGVVVVVVARAGLVEVVAVVEAGSWLWGPPVVVVMAGLRARLGVAEGVVEAEALGQEVGKVGASLPASGALGERGMSGLDPTYCP